LATQAKSVKEQGRELEPHAANWAGKQPGKVKDVSVIIPNDCRVDRK